VYRPVSIRLGAAVSGFSLLVAGVLLLAGRRRG